MFGAAQFWAYRRCTASPGGSGRTKKKSDTMRNAASMDIMEPNTVASVRSLRMHRTRPSLSTRQQIPTPHAQRHAPGHLAVEVYALDLADDRHLARPRETQLDSMKQTGEEAFHQRLFLQACTGHLGTPSKCH